MKKPIPLLIIVAFLFFNCNQKTKQDSTSEMIEDTGEKQLKQVSQSVLYGIDISHHQNNEIDTITKQHDSLSFVICKATEGEDYIDPMFQKNWTIAKEKSFVRGAYHFYRTEDDPINQASFFLSAISSLRSSDLPPIVDFEGGGIDKTQSIKEIQSSLKKFLLELETKSKRTPVLYTGVHIGNKYLNDPFFANYPLWIASYNGEDEPNLPKIWGSKGWVFWQSSDSYTLGSTTNDFDKFLGNFIDLKSFIDNSHIK
jgi:lysozyme